MAFHSYKIMSGMRLSRSPVILMCCLLALVVTGCAESEFVANSVKGLRSPSGDYGTYKIGNPYQIAGKTYVPRVDYEYVETGVASWYGPNFHGGHTANGETFDQNEISAAHRTLPLPSMVRVTNLENGRALNVRVNDRGPFSRGRIIDLSHRAAQLLGFAQKGTALVRVEVLARESIALAHGMDGVQVASAGAVDSHPVPEAAPRIAVTSTELAPPPGARAAPPPTDDRRVTPAASPAPPASGALGPLEKVDGSVKRVPVAGNPNMFVQAGAFSQYVNAYRVQTMLHGVAPIQISQVDGAMRVFRVRLGPVATVEEADALLARVVANGISEARIVVD
jgi:rare lipoprotein A